MLLQDSREQSGLNNTTSMYTPLSCIRIQYFRNVLNPTESLDDAFRPD